MLGVGLIKHHCPFRAVAAAVSSTSIIAHPMFLPFLSERSSVGCLEEINSDLPEADFNHATVQLPKLETWTALQSAYNECFSYDLRFEYQTSKVIPSVLHGCTQ